MVAIDRSSRYPIIHKGASCFETDCIYLKLNKSISRGQIASFTRQTLTAATRTSNVPLHIPSTNWTHQSSMNSQQMMSCYTSIASDGQPRKRVTYLTPSQCHLMVLYCTNSHTFLILVLFPYSALTSEARSCIDR